MLERDNLLHGKCPIICQTIFIFLWSKGSPPPPPWANATDSITYFGNWLIEWKYITTFQHQCKPCLGFWCPEWDQWHNGTPLHLRRAPGMAMSKRQNTGDEAIETSAISFGLTACCVNFWMRALHTCCWFLNATWDLSFKLKSTSYRFPELFTMVNKYPNSRIYHSGSITF